MKQYIDLHMHSIYSDDGEFTPTTLVEKCHQAGITIMSIADHNSVKATNEAQTKAKELNITYIPAIEIDCTFKNINLHVLGYNIDYQHKDFTILEENIHKQEIAAVNKKLTLTNQLGFNLTLEDFKGISDNGVITGEMFAEVLLDKEEYKNHELLKPYRPGGLRDDNPYVNFYWDYYAQNKPCYVEIIFPTLLETIKLINKHGGVAVLAHPGNNLKNNFEIIDEMIDLGIQGIEVFSSYHDTNTINYFYNKALQKKILITCGSDYHGKTKPAINLGASGCNINQEIIEDLLKQYNLIKKS